MRCSPPPPFVQSVERGDDGQTAALPVALSRRATALGRLQASSHRGYSLSMRCSYPGQQQSKQKEAHHMLSEIYGWFTEGFDTADLQEAKALLEELA